MKRNHYWRSKRRHKLLQKKRHLKIYGDWTNETKFREHHCPRDVRNHGYTYWDVYPNVSERKRFAKRMTNRSIRQYYRERFAAIDPAGDVLDDIQAMRNADYEKYFDYWWCVD